MANLESYSFRRPERVDISEWRDILAGMRAELAELASGKPGRRQIGEYAQKLLADARAPARNPEMRFWGLAEPETLPADARVDFFHTPTYLAAAFLARSVWQFPELLEEIPGLEDTLRGALLACQSRKFQGHGYDGASPAMELFLGAGVHKFVESHPGFCPSFTKLFRETLNRIRRVASRRGKLRPADPPSWNPDDDPARMAELLKLAGEEPAETLLFVYGTLMRDNSARHLLAGAVRTGEATATGYSLYDLGAYPAAVPDPGGRVKGELYRVDRPTLERLNEYEGEGSLFKLERTAVANGDEKYPDVLIYAYNHPIAGARKVPFGEQPWSAAR
ncbi:MAG: gamma-glutamylcyclotransferase [Planctomycetota bacterium]|jgi:gamma-glutamylcyclotransferase (GGCT)/AIG2-like uncharacterized protein YtfP|nr:gamma-glutamylcyclotransferase [Planctomycetota bacterium]